MTKIDSNAAKNIEHFSVVQRKKVGVGHIHDSKWTGRECQTGAPAVLGEPSTQVEVVQLNVFAY